MAQMVYVLTTQVEKREWRPVAVVDEANLDAANQWVAASKKNDFVPLEMNDMSLTGLGDMPTNFKPIPTPAVDASVENLKGVNARLVRIIQQLAERHGDKDILRVLEQAQRPKSSSLLRKQDDQPNT